MLDLAISFLPGSFIALLEYVGFSGDRDLGLNRIYEVAVRPQGIRYPVACILLTINMTFTEYLFGKRNYETVDIRLLYVRRIGRFGRAGRQNVLQRCQPVQRAISERKIMPAV